MAYGEAEYAIIRLDQYNYTVKNIFYDILTLLLVDADAFRGWGNNGCPIIDHNVSFSDVWLHHTDAYDNLTFFSSCYIGEDVSPGFGSAAKSSADQFSCSLLLSTTRLDTTTIWPITVTILCPWRADAQRLRGSDE